MNKYNVLDPVIIGFANTHAIFLMEGVFGGVDWIQYQGRRSEAVHAEYAFGKSVADVYAAWKSANR